MRKRLSAFVTRASLWRPALQSVLQRTQENGWTVFVFGGTLRDLLAVSATAVPRDLDLVVSGTTREALHAAFSSDVVRVNRFGGLHLLVHKLPVDIWTLESTWAFREQLVFGSDFAELPKTTFLNVEAVAAELGGQSGRRRRVYAEGFFQAIRDRQVEINLEDNPYPGLCVVRSIITAQRLGFSLGPKLVSYILHHGSRIPLEELESIQLSHYGHLRLDRHALHALLTLVRKQAGSKKVRCVSLPQVQQVDWYTGGSYVVAPDEVPG
ncbi:MAG: hypothetical protein ACXU86_01270 [Archangium sp.]